MVDVNRPEPELDTKYTLKPEKTIVAIYDPLAPAFKNRLYTLCDEIIPHTAWNKGPQQLTPEALDKSYLCTRYELMEDIETILKQDTTILQDDEINAVKVYNLIKKVFGELCRCKRVDIKSVMTGEQKLPNSISGSVEESNFAFFAKSFQFVENYTCNASELPPKTDGVNTDVTKYSSDPLGSTGWNNNTACNMDVTKISNMSVNNVIRAVKDVEAQMTRFKDNYTKASNKSFMWNGSTVEPNGSNRVTFVKYWCHNGCHNCHSSSRSRR